MLYPTEGADDYPIALMVSHRFIGTDSMYMVLLLALAGRTTIKIRVYGLD